MRQWSNIPQGNLEEVLDVAEAFPQGLKPALVLLRLRHD
jgi:hypothetical protein